MSGSISARARRLRIALIVACVLAAPLTSAQLRSYNVLDQRISSYDVDRNNIAESRAVSQWVERSWQNLGQQQFAAMQWVDTPLLDFWPVEYDWGRVPSLPALTGWLTANSFFFGYQFGSSRSATAWSTITASKSYVINRAPIDFTPNDCFVTCEPLYTVSLSSTGSPAAPYHMPAGAGGTGGGGAETGGSLFEVPQGVPPLDIRLTTAGLAAGEVMAVGASLDIIDTEADGILANLFELVSSVEKLASGDYAYGYRMHNNSSLAVEALWEDAGFGELPVRLEPGESSAEVSFVSPFAPTSDSSLATLRYEGRSQTLPLQGTVEVFRPVPLPASVWLLGAAVLALVSGRSRLRRRI